MTPWDITKAAASHSALCGVLAGLSLALLAIITGMTASRAGTQKSEEVSGRHSSIPKAKPDQISSILEFLAISAILLILASITWGELAGYPSADEITRAADGISDKVSPAAATAVMASEFIVGAESVVILALGGLLIALAILRLAIVELGSASRSGAHFAQSMFVFLAGVSAFEVVSVLCVAQEIVAPFFSDGIRPERLGQLGAFLAVVVILAWRRLSRRIAFLAMLRFRVNGKTIGVIAVSSAAMALFGYAVVPVATFAHPVNSMSSYHVAAVAILFVSGLLFMTFIFVADCVFDDPRSEGNGTNSSSITRRPSRSIWRFSLGRRETSVKNVKSH